MHAVRLFTTGIALALVLAFAPKGAGQVRIEIVPGGGFGAGIPLLTPEAISKLKLTAEQKEKFGKIEQEYKDKQKAAGDKLREAIQGKDREKVKEAYQNSRADADKLRAEYLTRAEAVLTAEQKTTFDEVKKEQPRPAFLPIRPAGVGGQVIPPDAQEKLKLTEEQRKRVNELQKEFEAKIMGVLTDEQKKQFEAMKKGGILLRPGQPQNQ